MGVAHTEGRCRRVTGARNRKGGRPHWKMAKNKPTEARGGSAQSCLGLAARPVETVFLHGGPLHPSWPCSVFWGLSQFRLGRRKPPEKQASVELTRNRGRRGVEREGRRRTEGTGGSHSREEAMPPGLLMGRHKGLNEDPPSGHAEGAESDLPAGRASFQAATNHPSG